MSRLKSKNFKGEGEIINLATVGNILNQKYSCSNISLQDFVENPFASKKDLFVTYPSKGKIIIGGVKYHN